MYQCSNACVISTTAACLVLPRVWTCTIGVGRARAVVCLSPAKYSFYRFGSATLPEPGRYPQGLLSCRYGRRCPQADGLACWSLGVLAFFQGCWERPIAWARSESAANHAHAPNEDLAVPQFLLLVKSRERASVAPSLARSSSPRVSVAPLVVALSRPFNAISPGHGCLPRHTPAAILFRAQYIIMPHPKETFLVHPPPFAFCGTSHRLFARAPSLVL